jgi:RsiW-degrading membrane proteinase PrsW (M82 family)
MVLVPLLALAMIAPLIAIYFGFLDWIDRYEKEPFWLQCVAFLYGAVAATTLGGLLSGQMSSATASDILAWTGGATGEVDRYATWLWAPIGEEATKGFGVILFFIFGHLVWREFDGPMDGVVYGGLIGLGFTATEDVLYISGAYAENGMGGFLGLAFVRTVLGGLGHACYTGMTGLGWGLAVTTKNPILKVVYPTGGFALAIILHGIHNWLPTYLGMHGGIMSLLITWAFVLLWFLMVIVLIGRERKIVIRNLADEIGRAVYDERELVSLASLFRQGFANVALLFRDFRRYGLSKRRQHLLIELAFLKEKRSSGRATEAVLAPEEATLREQLLVNWRASQTGR